MGGGFGVCGWRSWETWVWIHVVAAAVGFHVIIGTVLSVDNAPDTTVG